MSRYRKKKYRKYGRNNTWGRFNYVIKTARNALRTAKAVKGLINTEFKYIDNDRGANAISTTGTIFGLNQCAEGDTESTRTGEQIKVKYLYIKGYMVQHASATISAMRIIIFSAPTKHDTMTPTFALLLESAGVYQPINKNATKRYRILYDKLFTLQNDGTKSRTLKIFKKFKNHKCRYEGAGAAETDLREGALYMAVISSEATNTPQIVFHNRIRFIDN